jgi:hypothetical protein
MDITGARWTTPVAEAPAAVRRHRQR